jgi:hypothetical protein
MRGLSGAEGALMRAFSRDAHAVDFACLCSFQGDDIDALIAAMLNYTRDPIRTV